MKSAWKRFAVLIVVWCAAVWLAHVAAALWLVGYQRAALDSEAAWELVLMLLLFTPFGMPQTAAGAFVATLVLNAAFWAAAAVLPAGLLGLAIFRPWRERI